MPSRASKRLAYSLAAVVIVAIVAGAAAEFSADRQRDLAKIRRQTGGDPDRGAEVIARAGCGTCHEIGGIPGALGKVGPPLKGVSGRVYIAGRLTNTPEHLTQWIRDPKSVDPMTAMPALGLSAAQARDVVAYLYAND